MQNVDKGRQISVETGLNPYENAMKQLQNTADLIRLDRDIYEILRQPKRILTVSLPIKMDDGRVKNFQGYRVQYNDARASSREEYAIIQT